MDWSIWSTKILQCDNRNEFMGEVLRLVQFYGIMVVHGRPHHPQSQGLIEQANAVLKQKIRMAKVKTGINRWSQFLPMAILAMNQQGTTYHIKLQLKFN